MKLFERAKQAGLSTVTEWLPGGKKQGNEWTAINPTRPDNNTGSFSVNLNTGRWKEFAGEECGNDVVSLYAYIFEAELSFKSASAGFKNHRGGMQVLAAKEILKKYDPLYIESDKDDFSPPKKSGATKWDGFFFVKNGISNPPELDLEWYKTVWGELIGTWDFKRYIGKELRIVMKVARFKKPGEKKNDRPFTLWSNGSDYKWRAKLGFDGDIPLYNEYLLDDRPNDDVCLSEGQKCGSVGEKVLGKDYISVAFYGGAGNLHKTHLDPILGRKGIFWGDGDATGRKVLKKLKEIDFQYKYIRTPKGKPKGWDLADAVDEGMDLLKIINETKEIEAVPVEEDPDRECLDNWKPPFKIVGTSAKSIYFYTEETCQLMDYRKSSLGKAQLLTIMPREDWGAMFPKSEGGIGWDGATDHILRMSAERPIFSSDLIRGSGAWIDKGRVVVNTGKKILCNGEEFSLFGFDSDYVYERASELPYTITRPNDTGKELLDICLSLDWQKNISGYMLAGWLLLSPFGGALNWRPHIWVNGPKGSGKTYIIQNIVIPTLGKFPVNALGSSTAAGVRQSIGKGTRPFVCDEMEGDDKKQLELIQDKLTMARQSSSGSDNAGAVLQGTADGDGTEYKYQSMWLAASIGVTLKYGADSDRWSLLTLANPAGKNHSKRAGEFEELKKMCEVLTPVWVNGLHSRSLNIFSNIAEAIEVFVIQVANLTGTRRSGDQIGTLLAGAYMCDHDTPPSASDARVWLEKFDLGSVVKDADKGDDEARVLDEILTYSIEIRKDKFSIGSLIMYWYTTYNENEIDGFDKVSYNFDGLDIVKSALMEWGIKLVEKDGGSVYIAAGHLKIKQIMRDTPWAENYQDMLTQLDFSGPITGPVRFGPIQKRYIALNASEMLGAIPF